MAKILYKAYRQEGAEVSGSVRARNNKEALAKLKKQGLNHISLLSDVTLGFDRAYMEGNSEGKLKYAEHVERQMQKGVGLLGYFKEMVQRHSILLKEMLFGERKSVK